MATVGKHIGTHIPCPNVVPFDFASPPSSGGTGKFTTIRGNLTYSYDSERLEGDAFEGHGMRTGTYWFLEDEL